MTVPGLPSDDRPTVLPGGNDRPGLWRRTLEYMGLAEPSPGSESQTVGEEIVQLLHELERRVSENTAALEALRDELRRRQ